MRRTRTTWTHHRPERPARRLLLESLEGRLALAADVVSGDPKDWPMYNHDAQGSRYNHAETVLSPATVGDLQVQWTLPTRGAVAGTPAVVNDIVYVADAAGWVYAASRDGDLLWEKELPGLDAIIWGAKVTASLLVTNRTAIVGDLGGSIEAEVVALLDGLAPGSAFFYDTIGKLTFSH